VIRKLGTDKLYLTIPFVLFGIFRYLYLVHQREEGGNRRSWCSATAHCSQFAAVVAHRHGADLPRPMNTPSGARRVPKPWGYELIWAHTSATSGSCCTSSATKQLSYQYHRHKDETIHVLAGVLELEVATAEGPRQTLRLQPGQGFHIAPGLRHRMTAIETCDILEPPRRSSTTSCASRTATAAPIDETARAHHRHHRARRLLPREHLLEEGYEVYGMVRRASTENFARIEHLRHDVELAQADLLDQLSLITLLQRIRPHELYNLAAQSFVPTSWEQPMLTAEFNAVGVARLLEAIRLVDREIRFYQARRVKCSARCARSRRPSRRRSIRAARMASPKCTGITSR